MRDSLPSPPLYEQYPNVCRILGGKGKSEETPHLFCAFLGLERSFVVHLLADLLLLLQGIWDRSHLPKSSPPWEERRVV